ncbi:unnamed protein product [Adineta ricciae]|uniref:Uncharacterized protein n=1 Tax=Adineta ricciae TaxID=249248 RepID=A0A815BEM1_ADIRI|nr:unnamed protein product [Adineta ricciae]
MNFYGKSLANITKPSRLFSTFCISNETLKLNWYSSVIPLLENLTMINIITESTGIPSNHSLIIKDLSIDQCNPITQLTSIVPSPLTRTKQTWFQYQWLFIFLSILCLGIVSVIFYLYVTRKKSMVIERMPNSSITLSHHFYEEPISVILQPSIDINEYDHVRDNYARSSDQGSVIKIVVPSAAKARKTKYTSKNTLKQQQRPKNLSSPKVAPHTPLHSASSTTSASIQKLPRFQSDVAKTVSRSPGAVGFNPMKNLSNLDLDEINMFVRDMFNNRIDSAEKPRHYRPSRIPLICPDDSNGHLTEYIKTRNHCLDLFEEYVNNIRRQHGLVRNAASDPPIFEPGISITGPHIKKDTAIVDKEDSKVIKKLNATEPRKKYALIHESMGIFIIGGYILHVNVPIQKEPTTDYLFKFTGETVKIPPLTPCRVHFGVYADANGIYIAGGQTINNELLDDIQRLNLQTLKWEHIVKLMNPIAACGMTLDDGRIYLVGGYDIVQGQTVLLSDFTVYNLSSNDFERSSDLPTPRCRSLVFSTNRAVFCVSGLVQKHNENGIKNMQICHDILRWSLDTPTWTKISETPVLTKYHALSFNNPYLEVTKRTLHKQSDSDATTNESYYDFRTNVWTNGRAPTPTESPPSRSITTPKKSKQTSKSKTPAKTPSKTRVKKTPSKK